MSERKVLNKYYPPDFDPSKIPKLKLPKDRQYVVRLMAPFNMRCKTCGEYIYKGKKFNARKETVQNEAYLGLPIFRFYIKCTRCLAEITFKTDPENTDYTMEHGATRNFQAEKLLEEEEKRVQKEREDEELNNPMKVLENRTKDSKLEMEVLENLQELKDLNQRQAHVDFEAMLRQHRLSEEERQKQEQEEDERETAALVEESRKRRLLEDSDSEEEDAPAPPRPALRPNPTAILDEAPAVGPGRGEENRPGPERPAGPCRIRPWRRAQREGSWPCRPGARRLVPEPARRVFGQRRQQRQQLSPSRALPRVRGPAAPAGGREQRPWHRPESQPDEHQYGPRAMGPTTNSIPLLSPPAAVRTSPPPAHAATSWPRVQGGTSWSSSGRASRPSLGRSLRCQPCFRDVGEPSPTPAPSPNRLEPIKGTRRPGLGAPSLPASEEGPQNRVT
uniref:Splicing factor YJU2 n=1 Tax=Equus caballus TaxID=9796 RepID=A0A9L0RP94_HORSE